MSTIKDRVEQEARDYLLKNVINKDAKLLIVIKSVSRSGMTRRMRVMINNFDVSYDIARLCDLSMNDTGLLITGCGMDMTFWLADYITQCLWPNNTKPQWLKGNGGQNCRCLEWTSI